MSGNVDPTKDESFETYAGRLILHLGPVVGGAALTKALGYRSQAAFRQAAARKRLPVRVFEFEGRRGRFADTQDIAAWLWQQRTSIKREEDAGPAERSATTREH